MMYVNIDAVAVSLNEMNIMYLINLFTIINMLSNCTSHAESFNDDSFVMKFIIIDFHNLFSVSIYVTSSYHLSHWILFFQHDSHLTMYFTIQFLRSSILHLHLMRFSVLLTSRCSSIWLLWHSYISSLFIKEVFFTLYIAANSFIRISFSSNRISAWTHFTSSWSDHLLKALTSSFLLSFL